MNLEEYLEALRTCPDEKLREELGIGDNYAVLLKDHYRKLCNFLFEAGFLLDGEETVGKELNAFPEGVSEAEIHTAAINAIPFFVYEGTVKVRVRNYLETYWTTGHNLWGDEERNNHKLKQLKTYNVTVKMHPLNETGFEPEDLRKFADAVIKIGEFLIEEGIPACLPNSVGQKYSFPTFDYSRIVYHEPEKCVRRV